MIAHRGASAYAPEHTLEAYDLAIALGADVLELDVRLSRDAVPVIVHDRTLWRTTGDPRAVADLSVADLADLDPACGPLLLEEVLHRYAGTTDFLIDLKEPQPPLERCTLEVVARVGVGVWSRVQAFSRQGLRRAQRRDGRIALAQLYPPGLPQGLIRRELQRVRRVADTIGPEASSVDVGLVASAHRLGLRVQPYTVNDPLEIDRLLAAGVDGVITDVPDLVIAAAGRADGSLAAA